MGAHVSAAPNHQLNRITSLDTRGSILMQVHKKRIKKEDGRYLIFYTFTEDKEEGAKDVRTEMESNLKEMGNNSHPSPEQDL
jgi:hypothetical protein